MDITKKTNGLINYCKPSSFIQGLQNISMDLTMIGLPPITKYEDVDPAPTITSLINTIWTLLRQRQLLVDEKRRLNSELLSVTEELNKLKEKNRKLVSEMDKKQGDIIKRTNENLSLKMDVSEDNKQIKCLKHEVHELKVQLRNQGLKFKQTISKQLQENSSLAQRLRDVLIDQKVKNLKLSNSERSDPEECTKEEWYKKTIHRLEMNVQTLIQENLDLKKCLKDVTDDLSTILKKKK